jgi:hypothetical protein
MVGVIDGSMMALCFCLICSGSDENARVLSRRLTIQTYTRNL